MLRKSRYTARRDREKEISKKKIRNGSGRAEKGRSNEEGRENPYMVLHISLPERAI